MSLAPKLAIDIKPTLGEAVGTTEVKQAMHIAISKALRVAVARTIKRMEQIVPEATGRLLASGKRILGESLVVATSGTNLKSVYKLKVGWDTPYAAFVTQFNQSTTKWTKAGSQANYNLRIFNFVRKEFAEQLRIEINKLTRSRGRRAVTRGLIR